MTLESINQEIHLPEARARATLERLAEAGLLEALGNGRGRNYVLSAKMYRDPVEYVRQTDIDQLRYKELVLKLAAKKKKLTRKDGIELLHVSPPQAYRLLQKLVKENSLVLEGTTSGAYYRIPD